MIYYDLKTLTKTEKIILTLFLITSIFLTTKDFLDENIKYWSILSFVSLVTSFLNVLLIAKKKVSNFFWGILSCIAYGIFSFKFKYYGDSLNNFLFYLPVCFFSWYYWNKNKNVDNTINKIKFKFWHFVIYLFVFGVLYLGWYLFIPIVAEWSNPKVGYEWKGNFKHHLDAISNSIGNVSTFMIWHKLGVSNYLYLILNPINISMWISLQNFSLAFLYACYLLSTFVGFYYWYRKDWIIWYRKMVKYDRKKFTK